MRGFPPALQLRKVHGDVKTRKCVNVAGAVAVPHEGTSSNRGIYIGIFPWSGHTNTTRNFTLFRPVCFHLDGINQFRPTGLGRVGDLSFVSQPLYFLPDYERTNTTLQGTLKNISLFKGLPIALSTPMLYWRVKVVSVTASGARRA